MTRSTQDLARIAQALIAPGKGILAADECALTMANRFTPIGVESTLETRREYRSFAFATAGLPEYIGGVILQEETLKQKALDGTPFVDMLTRQGIVPGINVDTGLAPLPGSPQEWITEGLDGLSARCRTYFELGARFAKWRALINVSDVLPSQMAIRANAQALARYAAASQEAGLVPIVEPEVAMDGSYTLERGLEVCEIFLREVFSQLAAYGVALEGIVLKPSMVQAGNACRTRPTDEQIAEATLRALRRTVPTAVPGIAFLSGGQSAAEATARLSAINALAAKEGNGAPWQLSFAFGRALQGEALRGWNGKGQNAEPCQKAFMGRLRLVGAARNGKYSATLES